MQWKVIERAFSRPLHADADRRPQAGDLRVPRRRHRHLPAGGPRPPAGSRPSAPTGAATPRWSTDCRPCCGGAELGDQRHRRARGRGRSTAAHRLAGRAVQRPVPAAGGDPGDVRDRGAPARCRSTTLRAHIAADLAADIAAAARQRRHVRRAPGPGGRHRGHRRERTATPACAATRWRRPASPPSTPATPTSSRPDAADDWLCLLEAFDQPHRTGLVRAAAATMFFGETAADPGRRRRRADRPRRRDAAGVGRPRPRARCRGGLRGRAARGHGAAGAAVARRRAADDRPRARRRSCCRRLAHREHFGLPALRDWLRTQRDEQRRRSRTQPAPRQRRRGRADHDRVGEQGSAVPGRVPAVRVQPLRPDPGDRAVPRGRPALPHIGGDEAARTSPRSRPAAGRRWPATTSG